MKIKSILFVIALFIGIFANASTVNELKGVWKVEGTDSVTVLYTFTSDSLFIDEIGNEGEGYAVKYNNAIIEASNENYSFSIKVLANSNNELDILVLSSEESLILHKLNNN